MGGWGWDGLGVGGRLYCTVAWETRESPSSMTFMAGLKVVRRGAGRLFSYAAAPVDVGCVCMGGWVGGWVDARPCRSWTVALVGRCVRGLDRQWAINE